MGKFMLLTVVTVGLYMMFVILLKFQEILSEGEKLNESV